MTQYEVWQAIHKNGGRATKREIAQLTGLSLSTVQENLAPMRRAGVVRYHEVGIWEVVGPAPARNAYQIVDGEAVPVVDSPAGVGGT